MTFADRSHVTNYLPSWQMEIPTIKFDQFFNQVDDIELYIVDMIQAFTVGGLGSPRIAGIATPISQFVKAAVEQFGLSPQQVYLLNDYHHDTSVEFEAYPPHAVRGTSDVRTIPELTVLDYEQEFNELNKNCLNAFIRKSMYEWELEALPRKVFVGNCTDLCVYSNAMYWQMVKQQDDRDNMDVVVVANLCQTFDTPTHPGDLYHTLFLHHMQMNGITIVNLEA